MISIDQNKFILSDLEQSAFKIWRGFSQGDAVENSTRGRLSPDKTEDKFSATSRQTSLGDFSAKVANKKIKLFKRGGIIRQQKTRLSASSLTGCDTDVSTNYSWIHVGTLYHKMSTSQIKKCVDPTGIEPASQISWIQLHTSDGPTQTQFSISQSRTSNTSANDSSGYGRTGTLNGNPLWAPGKYGAGVNPVRYEKNELSNGVKLDGTGDNVSVSDFSY